MYADYLPPKLAEHFELKPPEVLYHYTGQIGLLGIIEKGELWATKIQYMNDTTELNLSLSMAYEILDAKIDGYSGKESGGEREACETLRRSLDGLNDINIFATCFCEDGDLLSQWRGYAEAGGGSAIGFDSHALEELASPNRFTLGKCIYDPVQQRAIMEEAITHRIKEQLAGQTERSWTFKPLDHGKLAEDLFRIGVFFKDQKFDEEKEWRLVSPVLTFREALYFRPGRSMITPYYKISIGNKGSLPITRVVVAPCPHMQLATSALNMLLMKHGMRGPMSGQQIVFASKIPLRNW